MLQEIIKISWSARKSFRVNRTSDFLALNSHWYFSPNMTLRTIFRSLILCLGLSLCFAQGGGVHAQQEFFPFLAEVTGDQVNVRSGQSANFERLCQLKKGDEVVVLEKGYSWYKIQMPPTAKSFVSKKYVQYLGPNAGGVTAERVNIRAGAGIHYTVLGQLAKGEQIYIEEELDEWYRIAPVAESYGWVTEKFLSFKSSNVDEYQSAYTRPAIVEDLVELLEEQPGQKEDVVEEPVSQVQEQEEKQEAGTFFAVGYVEEFKDTDGIH
jgi:SH3-like domain-containing protein